MSLQYLIKILYNFKNIYYIDNYDLLILCSFLLGIKVSINQYNPPFITEIKRKYSKKYSLLKYECNLVKGEKIKVKDGHSLMGRGFFIIRGSSEKEILDRADMVLREYI